MAVTNESLSRELSALRKEVQGNDGTCKAHSGFYAQISNIEKDHYECKKERAEVEKDIRDDVTDNRLDIREIKTKFAIFVIGGTMLGTVVVNAFFKWVL